jgi:hypothetical protein
MDSLLAGTFVERVLYSHWVSAALALTVFMLLVTVLRTRVVLFPRDSGLVVLVGLLFVAVGAATFWTLSSPGTALNHAIEWVDVSLIGLAACARQNPSLTRGVSLAVAGLVVWAAAQNVAQVRRVLADDPGAAGRAAGRRSVVDQISRTPRVFTESALWAVLAGKPAVVVDPFMFRVLDEADPEIGQNLGARFDAREFDLVVLEQNPETPRGRRWFETVDLGWPTTARILSNYQLASQPAADVFLYVRKPKS